MSAAATGRLIVDNATLGYDGRVVSKGLSVEVPDRSFTVIVGPNGCGKSTLLRGLARLIKPERGAVLLDGRALNSYRAKELAKQISLLPQSSIAPDGITVADLVARGRFPYQNIIRQWTPEDEAAVASALAATNLADLSSRQVAELSGGQRQRVWIAMALAQQTPIVLLDEPTTYLDIAHQIDLLELFTDLNRQGHTLVAVLHDLNQAARYATHLIAMREGRIVAEGAPSQIITSELVAEVFGLDCIVVPDPVTGTPHIVPLSRERGVPMVFLAESHLT